MVGLLDIGPLKKTVTIRGVDVEVVGLPVFMVFEAMASSPVVRRLIAGKSVPDDMVSSLITAAPEAVAAAIAAGVGKHGDPEYIGFATTQLSAGETELLLSAIIELTFPQGLKNFLDRLTVLIGSPSDAAADGGLAAGMTSQQLSAAADNTGTVTQKLGV